ncbi:MAG: Asp23/Gls24 family envelope stress response protein [Candidatus Goldiibacteriota bacterium]|jgi:uncharacterized alkaline shock family protein YloU
MVEQKNDAGNIKISDDAIAAIACIAAKDVDGVVDLDGGTTAALAEALGVTDSIKGVKVEMINDTVSLDINLIVSFGREVSDVASEVQDKVRESIETMTGLSVDKVHVNINSVRKKTSLRGDTSFNI